MMSLHAYLQDCGILDTQAEADHSLRRRFSRIWFALQTGQTAVERYRVRTILRAPALSGWSMCRMR